MSPEEQERVVIRDKRRVHPDADRATPPPDAGEEAAPSAEESVPKAVELLLEERTRDLQRVQAEYANYRKRADRDRQAAGDVAIGRVLTELLPVLDDIDRARAHGDLTGALKAVSDHLDTIFGKLGLVQFGEVGDPFDPMWHEAVTHAESDEVSEPTATMVLRKGYKHGDRLLRPAMVGVTDPITPTTSSAPQQESAEQPAETPPTEQASPSSEPDEQSE